MAEIKINMDALKSFRKTVRHKVKLGNNIYRILPPFGENSNGYPYHRWSIVWGLKDPTTGNSRPYASSSSYEGRCPVFDYLDALKIKLEKSKNEMTAAGATPDQIKERFKEVNQIIGQLRPKTIYAYNAVDKSGTVGILELKATAHKKLLTLMNNYIADYNQDPTSLGAEPSDSGVWINIVRDGEGLDTEYDARKNQIMQKDSNGIPSYTDDRQALPESVVNDYANLGYDLTALYQKKTYDELKAILVENLASLSKDNKDLVVEGFESTIISSVTTMPANGTVTITTSNVPTASFPQGAGAKIKIDALADDGQILADEESYETESTEDLMKMAEEVFG